MGKLVVLNGTDEEWKIAVYPHVVRNISTEEKNIVAIPHRSTMCLPIVSTRDRHNSVGSVSAQ